MWYSRIDRNMTGVVNEPFLLCSMMMVQKRSLPGFIILLRGGGRTTQYCLTEHLILFIPTIVSCLTEQQLFLPSLSLLRIFQGLDSASGSRILCTVTFKIPFVIIPELCTETIFSRSNKQFDNFPWLLCTVHGICVKNFHQSYSTWVNFW